MCRPPGVVLGRLRDELRHPLLRYFLPQPCRQPYPVAVVVLHLGFLPSEEPVTRVVQLLQLVHLPVGRLVLLAVVPVVVRALGRKPRGGGDRAPTGVGRGSTRVEVVLLVHRLRLLVVAGLLRVTPAHLLLRPSGPAAAEPGDVHRPRVRRPVRALLVVPVVVVPTPVGVSARLARPVASTRGRPARPPYMVPVHRQVRVLSVRLIRPLDQLR